MDSHQLERVRGIVAIVRDHNGRADERTDQCDRRIEALAKDLQDDVAVGNDAHRRGLVIAVIAVIDHDQVASMLLAH